MAASVAAATANPAACNAACAADRPSLAAAPLAVDTLPDIDASYLLCRDIAKEHSKTFYFASLFLTAEKRRAVWAVYAFCRSADDVADSSEPAPQRLAAIDAWRERRIARSMKQVR